MVPPPDASVTDAVPTADEVRATIDDLQCGLALLPLERAHHWIDAWHHHLATSDRTDLHAIAASLDTLRTLLTNTDRDGAAIGTVLADLGAQTIAAAQQADTDGVGRAVNRLGALLFHAGHALHGPRSSYHISSFSSMATPSDISGTSGLSDTYQNDLETTTAALEGGVTSLSPSAALGVIDTWRDTLKNAERDDLNHIANLLAELKDALQADQLNGRTIGSLMLRLGEQTTNAAADASDARLTPTLERLGALLTRAGTSLGGKTVEAHRDTSTG